MRYRVREDLFYCRVSNHIVFLDLSADRYFALQPGKAAQFDRLLSNGADGPEGEKMASRFVRQNILVESDAGEQPPPFSLDSFHTVVNPGGSAPPARRRLTALIALIHWRTRYRLNGLPGVTRRYRHLGRSTMVKRAAPAGEIIAAFSWAEQVVTAHDHCVPRSLALASALRASGHRPTVVIGVQLRPFAAHCWVQLGAAIANDQLDTIRPYTPILAI